MSWDPHKDDAPSGFSNLRCHLPLAYTLATFLTKLAKHLVVLGCVMIVGEATGRSAVGQSGILLLVVFAALLHSVGCALRRSLPNQGPLQQDRL